MIGDKIAGSVNPPAIVKVSRPRNNAIVERGILRVTWVELLAPQSFANIMSLAQQPDKFTAVTALSLIAAALLSAITFLSL